MESEKIFSSKKAVLEYLGKSPNDRKLVDRMIAKGEIRKVDGWYELFQKAVDEESEELKKKVADLELELEMCRAEKKNLEEQLENSPAADYKEARVQWLYYADEYEKEKADKEKRIRKCFQWIKARNPKANWEEFRDWVMSDE